MIASTQKACLISSNYSARTDSIRFTPIGAGERKEVLLIVKNRFTPIM